MTKFRIVFSNDDIGTGGSQGVQWFNDVTEYLHKWGIRGTFFWVPLQDGFPTDQDKDWMEAIEAAMSAGHDVQWHGLTHDCLEFGVPQPTFREENKAAFDRYDAEPLKWAYEHSLPRIREKLAQGLEIFERNFGRPVVFRSPCIGMCDETYQGLAELGIRYSSSRVINPQSWLYTFSRDPNYMAWEPEFSPYPYKVLGVTEIPLMSDYSHCGIPDDKLEDFLSLAKSDYEHLIEESEGLGVMLSHFHSMHKTWETTLKFYDRLLDFLMREHKVEFVTFKDILSTSSTERLSHGKTSDKWRRQSGCGFNDSAVAACTEGSARAYKCRSGKRTVV